MWQSYRRGASSYTPLLVSLPASKEASKSAVEEPLRECGLSSLTEALEGGSRRWLIILDGFDEVQGNTNFIVGNKLNKIKGVKVGGRAAVLTWFVGQEYRCWSDCRRCVTTQSSSSTRTPEIERSRQLQRASCDR